MGIASFRCHSCHLCQIQPNSFFYSINVIQLFNLKKMCYKLVKINDPSTMVLRCHCPASFFYFSPGFVLILLSVLFNSLHHFFFSFPFSIYLLSFNIFYFSLSFYFTSFQHFLLPLRSLFFSPLLFPTSLQYNVPFASLYYLRVCSICFVSHHHFFLTSLR